MKGKKISNRTQKVSFRLTPDEYAKLEQQWKATTCHLAKEQLLAVADFYMEKIGFGNQPYLVYQHHDAAHPHIHIVSVKVRSDGSRIDMHNIGRNQSEKARKAIEKEFNLVSAEAQKKQELYRLKPVSVSKVWYGKSQTKLAIQNVLENVLTQYRYTSLPELNTVLRQYNVAALRGSENSRVYRNRGLMYRVLDGNENPVGVPIKASLFYNKPTLAFLEKRFNENKSKRIPFKPAIKNAVDKIFLKEEVTLSELIKALNKQGIHVVLRQNREGLVYGITYVDHRTKCVFNGSALGKKYSAKAIQERCLQSTVSGQNLPQNSARKQIGLQQQADDSAAETGTFSKGSQIAAVSGSIEQILDTVIKPEQTSDYMPYQLKRNRKKRRRKRKFFRNNQ